MTYKYIFVMNRKTFNKKNTAIVLKIENLFVANIHNIWSKDIKNVIKVEKNSVI